MTKYEKAVEEIEVAEKMMKVLNETSFCNPSGEPGALHDDAIKISMSALYSPAKAAERAVKYFTEALLCMEKEFRSKAINLSNKDAEAAKVLAVLEAELILGEMREEKK